MKRKFGLLRNGRAMRGPASSAALALLSLLVAVAAPSSAEADTIATGGSHKCALTDGGRAKCWGFNRFSQLGDGTTEQRLTPVWVKDFP